MEDIQSPDGSFVTPLLLSLAGVVSTSIIIVVYHIVMVKFCKRRHENYSGSRGSTRGLRRRGSAALHDQMEVAGGTTNFGLEKNILEAIPVMQAKNDRSRLHGGDPCECAICLGEVEDTDVVRTLPNCCHVFHVSCIDEWLSAHNSCPTCRSRIVVAPILSSSDATTPFDGENREGDQHTVDISTSEPGADASDPHVVGTSGGRPIGVLRHSVSFALPMEDKHRRLITRLKRSLSMDQSDFVIINIQNDTQRNSPSSSSSTSSSSSSSCFESRQLDRVSFLVARSLSLIRVGRGGANNEAVLPL